MNKGARLTHEHPPTTDLAHAVTQRSSGSAFLAYADPHTAPHSHTQADRKPGGETAAKKQPYQEGVDSSKMPAGIKSHAEGHMWSLSMFIVCLTYAFFHVKALGYCSSCLCVKDGPILFKFS